MARRLLTDLAITGNAPDAAVSCLSDATTPRVSRSFQVVERFTPESAALRAIFDDRQLAR